MKYFAAPSQTKLELNARTPVETNANCLPTPHTSVCVVQFVHAAITLSTNTPVEATKQQPTNDRSSSAVSPTVVARSPCVVTQTDNPVKPEVPEALAASVVLPTALFVTVTTAEQTAAVKSNK